MDMISRSLPGLGALLIILGPLASSSCQAGAVHGGRTAGAIAHELVVDIELFEHVVAARAAGSQKFDFHHPFYAKLLTNSTFAERIIDKWEHHEHRFDYWNPFLWRSARRLSTLPLAVFRA